MVWGQVTRGQTALEDDWPTTTIRTRSPLKLSPTAEEEKGTQTGGATRGQGRGVKGRKGRGQDGEKCWFKGVEGEKWVGQS